jgi:hypothetical protein
MSGDRNENSQTRTLRSLAKTVATCVNQYVCVDVVVEHNNIAPTVQNGPVRLIDVYAGFVAGAADKVSYKISFDNMVAG